MTYLLMIIGAVAVGLVFGLMSDEKPKPKEWKPKKKTRSVWDDDPLYGTPLQKIK